jgi:hypothetical protein
MGLIENVGNGPLAIDTAVFIYFIEENAQFFSVVAPLFEAIEGVL